MPTPASGMTCEATMDSPIAAAIEESASSNGTPAMITEPNTISRVTTVTGRLMRSESARSASRWSLTPLLMAGDPVSSTTRSGWSAPTAAVCSRSGTTFFLPSSSGPFRTTDTSRTSPSFERTGAATLSTSGSSRIRAVTSRAAAPAAAMSSSPDPARIMNRSVGERSRPPSVAIASARPASPTQKSLVVASLVPSAMPTTRHRTTNANQPTIARPACRALHRAIRTGRCLMPEILAAGVRRRTRPAD